MEEDEPVTTLLRDRFRLSAMHIAQAEAKRNDAEISEPISGCIADLSLRYAEQLAKDLKVFAQHARRKTVKEEDVLISAHRNEGLTAALMSFCNETKSRETGPRWRTDRRKKKKLPTDYEDDDPDYSPDHTNES